MYLPQGRRDLSSAQTQAVRTPGPLRFDNPQCELCQARFRAIPGRGGKIKIEGTDRFGGG